MNTKIKYPIQLVKHNEKWKNIYTKEEKSLKILLSGINITVYHIGSTALSNIYAKNIVDILVEIDNKDFNEVITKLSSAWVLCWKEEKRAFLTKGYGQEGFEEKVVHLHIRNSGDIDEVYFRNYLLKHPFVAKDYETLKLDLEKRYKNDRESYTNGKTEFIKKYTTLAKKEQKN